MPSLNDLPVELLNDVLSQLSRPEISKLSRVCKIWHAFLSPKIYHCIDWLWEDHQRSPPFDLLLRTLLNNSRLASHVKVMRLRGGGIQTKEHWSEVHDPWSEAEDLWRDISSTRSIWDDGCRLKPQFDEEALSKMENIVYAQYRPPAADWVREFHRGNVDTFVALILRCLPSLEHLDLGFTYLHHAVFLPNMLRDTIIDQRISNAYSTLTRVDFALDMPLDSACFDGDLDLVRPLFFLPQIISINVVFHEPVTFAWPSPNLVPNFATLSSLILRKSTANEDVLEKLLSCTPQLQNLTYDQYRVVGFAIPHYECWRHSCPQELYPVNGSECSDCNTSKYRKLLFIRCRRLDMALSHVQNTLQTLVLKIDFSGQFDWEKDPYDNGGWPSGTVCGVSGRLSILKKMPKLRSIELPWVLLFGWEADTAAEWRERDSEIKLPVGEEDCDLSDYDWSGALPSGLEHLCLRDDMNDFANYQYSNRAIVLLIKHLIGTQMGYFKSLRDLDFYFTWNWHYLHTGWPTRLANDLMDLCRLNNINTRMKRDLSEKSERADEISPLQL